MNSRNTLPSIRQLIKRHRQHQDESVKEYSQRIMTLNPERTDLVLKSIMTQYYVMRRDRQLNWDLRAKRETPEQMYLRKLIARSEYPEMKAHYQSLLQELSV